MTAQAVENSRFSLRELYEQRPENLPSSLMSSICVTAISEYYWTANPFFTVTTTALTGLAMVIQVVALMIIRTCYNKHHLSFFEAFMYKSFLPLTVTGLFSYVVQLFPAEAALLATINSILFHVFYNYLLPWLLPTIGPFFSKSSCPTIGPFFAEVSPSTDQIDSCSFSFR